MEAGHGHMGWKVACAAGHTAFQEKWCQPFLYDSPGTLERWNVNSFACVLAAREVMCQHFLEPYWIIGTRKKFYVPPTWNADENRSAGGHSWYSLCGGSTCWHGTGRDRRVECVQL